jgi:Spy/CpxP family protein refolding chaperone
MKEKGIAKLIVFSAILSLLLVVPVLGQTDEELGKQLKEYKAKTLAEIKLDQNQIKKLTEMEDKFSVMRGKLMDVSKQAWDELQAALAADKPDNAKVKSLVKAYLGAQSDLFSSFRKELDQELAEMSPIQQGQFLVAMEKWRQKCMPAVCIPVKK